MHIELGDPRPLFERLRALGLGVGLVCNPETPVDDVLPHLPEIDLLLLMTVNPGWGGQAFMAEVLDKAALASPEIDSWRLDVEIEVDGGINVETARRAGEAGADILVAGSAVFGADDPPRPRAIRAAAWPDQAESDARAS